MRSLFIYLTGFSILMLLLTLQPLLAQDDDQPMTRKIEVYGTAEEEVVPDEIYFSISLKEYQDTNKKIPINKLERQLYDAVQKIGIPKEDLRIENVASYNYDWYREDTVKRKEFLASKEYQIKLSDLNKVNELLSSLDSKGIQSTNIDRYDHSQIEQYRRDLKIKALRDAQEKATYLLQGIDAQIGPVLEIQEIDTEGNQPPVYYRESRAMAMSADDEAAPQIESQKIKLRFQVRAVFEIE